MFILLISLLFKCFIMVYMNHFKEHSYESLPSNLNYSYTMLCHDINWLQKKKTHIK